jgi:hypothetical protein
MKITFENGLKKIKFYDRVLWTILISFVVSLVLAFSGFSGWLFILLLLVFVFSSLTFFFGMLYWMILTKNYLLLFLSFFMGFITILFYFGRMRKKYFREGKV